MSAKTKQLALGVDIGAHKAGLVLFDGEDVIDTRYNPYPQSVQHDFELWKEWLLADVRDFIYGKKIMKVGLCAAGVIFKGRVLRSPHLALLDGQRLDTLLSPVSSIDVVENDAKAFLAAEVIYGIAQKYDHVAALTLGTGIGGAFLMEGAIIRGAHNAAGEIGHMILEGNKTFEDLASSRFIKTLNSASPRELEEAAKKGDKQARQIYETFGTNLGKGIANIINALDPEIIVLGGGLSHAHTLFIPALRQQLEKHVLLPDAQKTPVKASKTGRHAPAVGAALLALRGL